MASSSFPDHFSSSAARYAAYRPHYPAALFEWLARVAPGREVAWDCGTGSGQSATALAEHVALVVATDPSTAQLAHAARHARVLYAAMSAERSALASASVELITVAQALHWFDQRAFFAEARRVLVPHGVIAVWSYGVATLHDETLDALVRRFHGETVGPYWPPERRLVDEGYRDLVLPFEPVQTPAFTMEATWTLEQLAGYLSTWSAVQRARAATGEDPLTGFVEVLRPAWGARGLARRVEWPLTLLVGRADDARSSH
jgi:ubiquinone/menaquinone biosynthesis C-methylase UbiE